MDPIDKPHTIVQFSRVIGVIGYWVMGICTLTLLAASLIWGNAAMFFTLCIPVGFVALSIWDKRRCKKKIRKRLETQRRVGWKLRQQWRLALTKNLLADNQRMTPCLVKNRLPLSKFYLQNI